MNYSCRTAMVEHLALESPLTLDDFCNRIRQIFNLPEFHFDSENETEWGLVEVENIEYNVSRPYEEGTLQEWDDTVPTGCNFGISLIVFREHPQANNYDWPVYLAAHVGQHLANGLNLPVYHHRSWRGSGNNTIRSQCFHPTRG